MFQKILHDAKAEIAPVQAKRRSRQRSMEVLLRFNDFLLTCLYFLPGAECSAWLPGGPVITRV